MQQILLSGMNWSEMKSKEEMKVINEKLLKKIYI